jgi:hypothetical protein
MIALALRAGWTHYPPPARCGPATVEILEPQSTPPGYADPMHRNATSVKLDPTQRSALTRFTRIDRILSPQPI